MSSDCDALPAFLGATLDDEAARRFEQHLGGCDACARGLGETLVLDELVAQHAPRRRLRLGRRPVIAAAVALSAAAAIVVMVSRGGPAPAALVASLAGQSSRTTEARLSYPAADVYRPLAVMRGAGGGGTVPVDLVAKIEEAGDSQATAAAYFLVHLPAQAEARLAGLPESADVLNDRAAALLELGRREEALAALDRALQLRPGHPQALWNRGLVLRALGRRAEAARAFTDAAAAAGPGWSGEARERARDLER